MSKSKAFNRLQHKKIWIIATGAIGYNIKIWIIATGIWVSVIFRNFHGWWAVASAYRNLGPVWILWVFKNSLAGYTQLKPAFAS
jgi:hypothetical protein